jgi:hypothetical protein
MGRLRSGRALALAPALALGLWLLSRAPANQTVHYVLGEAAPLIEELDVRWREDELGGARGGPPSAPLVDRGARGGPPSAPLVDPSDDESIREVSYRFAAGTAPRIVTHEPRLSNGDYSVEIEVVLASSDHSRTLVSKRVQLTGGVLSINVGSAVVHQ